MPISLTFTLDRSTKAVKDEIEEHPEFFDSSGLLYHMYRKMTEEEDTKMSERWQRDAKAIFLFVSPQLTFLSGSRLKSKSTDRFVLCRSCALGLCHNPGPQAESPGYYRILFREDISGSRRL